MFGGLKCSCQHSNCEAVVEIVFDLTKQGVCEVEMYWAILIEVKYLELNKIEAEIDLEISSEGYGGNEN